MLNIANHRPHHLIHRERRSTDTINVGWLYDFVDVMAARKRASSCASFRDGKIQDLHSARA